MSQRLITLSLLFAATACGAAPQKAPDLEAIYERAARFEPDQPGQDMALRNPIVVIPGILGSRLKDTESGSIAWGAFTGNFADPSTPAGARLIAFPMEVGKPLRLIEDSLAPDGALANIELSILGMPFQLQAYYGILRTLGAAGYLDESMVTGMASGSSEGALNDGEFDWGDQHFTCFQFDYDWRRSVPENASRLSDFLGARATEVRAKRARIFGEEAGKQPVQFDLVAHSMGGLVARWYLRYGADQGVAAVELEGQEPVPAIAPTLTWAGAKRVDRCILVATPNLGSTGALSDLVHGMNLGIFAADYAPSILGTMPSAYQLLPRGPGTLINAIDPDGLDQEPDIYDAALWRNLGWGLASPAADPLLASLLPEVADPAERRVIAMAHQAKCLSEARRVAEALDAPAARPEGVELYLFSGDAIETPAAIQYLAPAGDLWTKTSAPGDGVVTRASALADLRSAKGWSPRLQTPIDWTAVTFLFEEHLALVDAPSFVDNLLWLLLEDPRN